MIIFLFLLCALLALCLVGLFYAIIFGWAFMLVFGDIFICVLIIIGIVTLCKKIFGKKKDGA